MRLISLLLAAMLGLVALPGVAQAQSVGVASAVDESALGTAPSEKPRTMVLGDRIIHNEKIETNGKGLLQILLADGTSFTVGPNSSMSIDSFVYSPDANTAKVVATLGRGVFRFIGGRTSKTPDGAQLNTLVGSVGIQGGIGDFDFSGKGKPFHIDMLFGNSIILTDHGTVIGRILENGYSIILGPNHTVSVVKTPAGWTQSFQHDVTSHGTQHGGAPHNAGTVIQTAFKETTQNTGGTPSTPGAGSNGQSQEQTVADGEQPPPPQPPTTGLGSDSTWAAINNSSLANVEATYLGTYSFAYATTGSTYVETTDGPSTAGTFDGDFSLDYHFGASNGGGTLAFAPPSGLGGDPVTASIAVAPLSTGGGRATFGVNIDQEITPSSGDVIVDEQNHGTIVGTFEDTAAGVGHGVSGTLDFNDTTQTTETGHPTQDGSITMSGTFSGDLDHTTP